MHETDKGQPILDYQRMRCIVRIYYCQQWRGTQRTFDPMRVLVARIVGLARYSHESHTLLRSACVFSAQLPNYGGLFGTLAWRLSILGYCAVQRYPGSLPDTIAPYCAIQPEDESSLHDPLPDA